MRFLHVGFLIEYPQLIDSIRKHQRLRYGALQGCMAFLWSESLACVDAAV